jgi:ribosome-associated toxin RatA of RatAB toxin-antitoxin module
MAMPLFRPFALACLFVAAALQGAPPVSLSELDEHDQYYVQASFLSPSAPPAVFAVLSDYDHLAGVLSGLRSSRITARDEQGLLVEQVLQGQFLFFRRALRLVLRIQEQAPWRIEFSQGEAKPFRHYQGSWVLEPLPDGTRVDYTLTVSRGDMAPVFIERKLFRDNARLLMEELQREVAVRAAQTDSKQEKP